MEQSSCRRHSETLSTACTTPRYRRHGSRSVDFVSAVFTWLWPTDDERMKIQRPNVEQPMAKEKKSHQSIAIARPKPYWNCPFEVNRCFDVVIIHRSYCVQTDIVGVEYAGVLVHWAYREKQSVLRMVLQWSTNLVLDDWFLQRTGISDSHETGEYRIKVFHSR